MVRTHIRGNIWARPGLVLRRFSVMVAWAPACPGKSFRRGYWSLNDSSELFNHLTAKAVDLGLQLQLVDGGRVFFIPKKRFPQGRCSTQRTWRVTQTSPPSYSGNVTVVDSDSVDRSIRFGHGYPITSDFLSHVMLISTTPCSVGSCLNNRVFTMQSLGSGGHPALS